MSEISIQTIPRIPEIINFSQEEEKVLELWRKVDAFKNTLKQSKGKPR